MLPKVILIIEDEIGILDNLSEMLENNRYVPLLARDGWEGLRMAIDYSPDLILCDLHIPGISGLEIAKTLKSQGITIPFIFQTADVRIVILEVLEEYGTIIKKPFGIEELINEIDRVLYNN